MVNGWLMEFRHPGMRELTSGLPSSGNIIVPQVTPESRGYGEIPGLVLRTIPE
jgi:hypothetical protein